MRTAMVKYHNRDLCILMDDNFTIVLPVWEYMKHVSGNKKAINTQLAYISDLKMFYEFLEQAKYKYSEVGPKAISEFREYLMTPNLDGGIAGFLHVETKRTARTINRILSTVRGFYEYLNLFGANGSNPVLHRQINRPINMPVEFLAHVRKDNKTSQSVFKIKVAERPTTIVEPYEAEIILSNLSNWRDRLIFKLMYETGARIDEVLSLKIESIPAYIDIDEPLAVLKNIDSKGKKRDLLVHSGLLDDLDSFIDDRRKKITTSHTYVFVSEQRQNIGKPLTYHGARAVFDRVKKRTGIHFNFHDLRRTFGHDLRDAGVDISIIKLLYGHESVTTTMKYLENQKRGTHINVMREYWRNHKLLGGGEHGDKTE